MLQHVQYISRDMHTVFVLLCFVVVIHWLIFSYPSGLLHWHCGNLTIAPVPAKQPWWILINTSCEFIMNDCITTTKQSTTKPCAYFLGYTVAVFVNQTMLYMTTSCMGTLSALLTHWWELTGNRWTSFTKGQWRRALIFSLLLVGAIFWISSPVTNDFKRNDAHVMSL